MAKRVLVLDTSILCCWLEVPNKETAGEGSEQWNRERVETTINHEVENNKSTLVLPIASLIEVGNHIAHAPSRRYECAQDLAHHLLKAIDATSPWAAFTEQTALWEVSSVRRLAASLPDLAKRKLSIADATIKNVADYYSKAGCDVRLLTGDGGLHEYHSETIPSQPRRAIRVIG